MLPRCWRMLDGLRVSVNSADWRELAGLQAVLRCSNTMLGTPSYVREPRQPRLGGNRAGTLEGMTAEEFRLASGIT